MENNIIKKLTVVIEATKDNKLSSDVMKSIHNFEKLITSHNDIKFTLSLKNEQNHSTNLYPENWNYWPG